jgi:hypothetical protein
VSIFPKRPPHVMHGLAALLGADKTGGIAQPLPGVPGAPSLGAALKATRTSDKDAEAALGALLARLGTAEHRVNLVEHYLTGFEQQAQALPEDHAARMTCAKIVDVLRLALKWEPHS